MPDILDRIHSYNLDAVSKTNIDPRCQKLEVEVIYAIGESNRRSARKLSSLDLQSHA